MLQRLLFVGLSTVITVFFSEKAFAYPQGYTYAELLLYYAFPVYACLWAIDRFRVRRPAALVLVAALYAFLVEGVLTLVLYEGGLLDPTMPAYFVGWHGLLSFVFGWYALRKWLVRGQWERVLAMGFVFGLFWGLWSLTYWLPEAYGEWGVTSRWSIADFGLYTFTFTATLALSHGLLGRGVWLPEFRPGRVERWVVGLVLVALFIVNVLLILPLAIFKLAALLGVIFLALRAEHVRGEEKSVLSELAGPVKGLHLPALLSIPIAATGVYALAVTYRAPEEWIRALLLESTPFFQALIGAGLFLWALVATLGRRRAHTKRSVIE